MSRLLTNALAAFFALTFALSANQAYAGSIFLTGHDPDFQGYGAVQTDRTGRYAFRTIKPAAYGSAFFRRTPHIHFRIAVAGVPPLVTQMYFAGDPLNRQDGILNSIEDAGARARLIVPFRESPQIEPGSHAGHFDIVL